MHAPLLFASENWLPPFAFGQRITCFPPRSVPSRRAEMLSDNVSGAGRLLVPRTELFEETFCSLPGAQLGCSLPVVGIGRPPHTGTFRPCLGHGTRFLPFHQFLGVGMSPNYAGPPASAQTKTGVPGGHGAAKNTSMFILRNISPLPPRNSLPLRYKRRSQIHLLQSVIVNNVAVTPRVSYR